jgi:hypothetical protein
MIVFRSFVLVLLAGLMGHSTVFADRDDKVLLANALSYTEHDKTDTEENGDGHDNSYDGDNIDHPIDRYVPFSINALDYDEAKELDNSIQGDCKIGQPPSNEPDAQTTEDATCQKLGPCRK